jgi:hypothetical protein
MINEFISMWTPDIYSTEARALPSAVKGCVACSRRHVLSKVGYSNSPDLNATFTFVCPRSP